MQAFGGKIGMNEWIWGYLIFGQTQMTWCMQQKNGGGNNAHVWLVCGCIDPSKEFRETCRWVLLLLFFFKCMFFLNQVQKSMACHTVPKTVCVFSPLPWQGTLASNVDSLVAEILGGAVCTVYLHAVLVWQPLLWKDTHQNPGNNVAKWFGSRAFGGK